MRARVAPACNESMEVPLSSNIYRSNISKAPRAGTAALARRVFFSSSSLFPALMAVTCADRRARLNSATHYS